MLLLTGEYRHVVDKKGRVLIANRLRSQIDESEYGSHFYLLLGANGILCLYPDQYFERMSGSVVPDVTASDEAVAFERMSFAFANRIEVDNQGRILLTDRLRKRAGLTEHIVMIGVRDHVELWNEPDWEQYVSDHMQQFQKQMSQARRNLLQNKTVQP